MKMTINELYDFLNCEDASNNPFEPEAFTKAYHTYYDKYIDGVDIDAANEAYFALGDVISIASRSAFAVGYRTAVSLFLSAISTPVQTEKAASSVGAPEAASIEEISHWTIQTLLL